MGHHMKASGQLAALNREFLESSHANSPKLMKLEEQLRKREKHGE